MGERELTVCIVDADSAVRDSLEVLIDLSGMLVRSFSSIRCFLNARESISVQCLLCEAEMPDGSGIMLHSILREKGADFPFALLVSENKPRIFQRATEAGIRNIFQKPLMNHAGLLKFIRNS